MACFRSSKPGRKILFMPKSGRSCTRPARWRRVPTSAAAVCTRHGRWKKLTEGLPMKHKPRTRPPSKTSSTTARTSLTGKAVEPGLTLVEGDCLEKMRYLAPASVKLLCADPPYNFNEPYDLYDDHRPFDEYLGWTQKWLGMAHTVLARDGALWVFCPDEWVSEIDVYCKHELGLYQRSHVVWFYTFGVCNSSGKNFSRSHGHLLYYVKDKRRFTFNGPAVGVPSARALVYNDPRANPNGKMPDNTWLLLKKEMDPVFTPDLDTWLESR